MINEEKVNILLVGNEGYIGSVLSSYLSRQGHGVIGIDTGFYRERDLYTNICIKTMSKDIRCVTVEDLWGFDVAIHLAELSNDPLGMFDPEVTYEINYQGSINLALKCKAAKIQRFVYASSCSVYGEGGDAFKTEESTPNPLTPYAKCKVLVEKNLSFLADNNFSPTVLRLATVYGPSPRLRFDTVLNNLAGLAWTQETVQLASNGKPWRPLVHIQDICEAFSCVVNSDKEITHNQVFNVGDTAENYQIKDIAVLVANVFQGSRYSIGVDEDTRSYRVSFEKIRKYLANFKCQRNVETGANELLELFRRINLTTELFLDRSFTRLEQIRYLIKSGQINEKLFWVK